MLKNKSQEKQLLDQGFVKIPFLNESEIELLNQFYNSNPVDFDSPFHSTPLSTDINYRTLVNQTIKEAFHRAIEANFTKNFQYFFGSFTVKESSKNSEWNLHQDWTFVDESMFTSVGVWVPLLDVNAHNGCLSIVKRSHKFIKNIRGTHTFSEYSGISETIKENFLTSIPMRAGEAVIFTNNLLHYSPPNNSNQSRISVNCLMFPKRAQPIHYYHNQSWEWNEVEKFEISTETMLNHNFKDAERPKTGKSLGKLRFDTKALSLTDFEELYLRHNGNILERLQQFLKKTTGS